MVADAKDFEILGLTEDASKEKVQKAYTVLLKRYKNTPEKLSQVNRAYDHIMGYLDEDEKEEEPKGIKNFFNKLFGRNKDKK